MAANLATLFSGLVLGQTIETPLPLFSGVLTNLKLTVDRVHSDGSCRLLGFRTSLLGADFCRLSASIKGDSVILKWED